MKSIEKPWGQKEVTGPEFLLSTYWVYFNRTGVFWGGIEMFTKWPRLIIAVATFLVIVGAMFLVSDTSPIAQAQGPQEPDLKTTLQSTTQTALGNETADLKITCATILNVFTTMWERCQDVVIKGERFAYVGSSGAWPGKATKTIPGYGLYIVPGFLDPHKHIESSHLSPDREAEMVLPQGVTGIYEASHEFGNVNGPKNTEFWTMPRKLGSPLKIYVLTCTACPPTGYEVTGGYNDKAFFVNDMKNAEVVGSDEFMNLPALFNKTNPDYGRSWDIITVTRLAGKIVQGHGSGVNDWPTINAMAAAGLMNDHEVKQGDEVWKKLQVGILPLMRPASFPAVIPYFKAMGLTNWSNVTTTTDDRSVEIALRDGTMNYNIREAIKAGVPVEWAYMMGSYNVARLYHMEYEIGAIAPPRRADFVVLRDPATVNIYQVYSDGQLVAQDGKLLAKVPTIQWPSWTKVMNVRQVTPADFVVSAAGKTSVVANVLGQFYFAEPMTATLTVKNGEVQRDIQNGISKECMVDRYTGQAGPVGCAFWKNTGPSTPKTAVCSSVAHDNHNLWVQGSDDESMAQCINRLEVNGGGWVLISEGKVVGEVVFEIGGLMSARPPRVVADELLAFWKKVEMFQWLGVTEPINSPNYAAVVDNTVYRSIFAALTCTPWVSNQIPPTAKCRTGIINVQNGQCYPVYR